MSNILEREISVSLNTLGWFCLKVPVPSRPGVRFVSTTPCDFICIVDGVGYGLEAKVLKEGNAFPVNRLTEHQLHGLAAIEAAGGRAYVVISVRRPRPKAFAIRIADWNDMVAELDRKSMPIEILETDARVVRLPRIRTEDGYIWDFDVLRSDS